MTTVNDEPWADGLYPISVRGKSEDGKWLRGSEARVVPGGAIVVGGQPVAGADQLAIWYDTREPADDWRKIDGTCQVQVLAKPGSYTIQFRGSKHGEREYEVTVDDPYDQLELSAWKGQQLWRRMGTWDEYISKESSYRALEFREGDIVADMGAHIGVFARRALEAGAARVVCWEPEPVNLEVLRRNLGLVGDPERWEIVGACVVEDSFPDSDVRLWIDSAGDGDMGRTALHSIVRDKGNRLARRVPAVRWGDVLEELKPTVLKVDVEGAELTYDWSRVPTTVREIGVEFEKARKSQRERYEEVQPTIAGLGFEVVSETKGWSIVQVWRR